MIEVLMMPFTYRRPCLAHRDDPTDRPSWCWNWEEPNLIIYHCSRHFYTCRSRCHLSKWKVDMDTLSDQNARGRLRFSKSQFVYLKRCGGMRMTLVGSEGATSDVV